MEQRNKGYKPPFFINSSQGKPSQNEAKMTKSLGKRPRKHPIYCWGCEGEHMYIDFHHIGERMRIVYNV
jgi:hypothetical protein